MSRYAEHGEFLPCHPCRHRNSNRQATTDARITARSACRRRPESPWDVATRPSAKRKSPVVLPTGTRRIPNQTKAPQLSRGSADRAIGLGEFPQCRTGRSHAWSRGASSSRREHRISHGRGIEIRPPLFPGYCFLTVEAQWYAAPWSIGVIGLIMDGIRPRRQTCGCAWTDRA